MQQLIRRRQREAAEERESRREGTNSILSTRVPAAIYVVTSLLVFLCGILLTVTILSLGTDPDLDLSIFDSSRIVLIPMLIAFLGCTSLSISIMWSRGSYIWIGFVIIAATMAFVLFTLSSADNRIVFSKDLLFDSVNAIVQEGNRIEIAEDQIADTLTFSANLDGYVHISDLTFYDTDFFGAYDPNFLTSTDRTGTWALSDEVGSVSEVYADLDNVSLGTSTLFIATQMYEEYDNSANILVDLLADDYLTGDALYLKHGLEGYYECLMTSDATLDVDHLVITCDLSLENHPSTLLDWWIFSDHKPADLQRDVSGQDVDVKQLVGLTEDDDPDPCSIELVSREATGEWKYLTDSEARVVWNWDAIRDDTNIICSGTLVEYNDRLYVVLQDVPVGFTSVRDSDPEDVSIASYFEPTHLNYVQQTYPGSTATYEFGVKNNQDRRETRLFLVWDVVGGKAESGLLIDEDDGISILEAVDLAVGIDVEDDTTYTKHEFLLWDKSSNTMSLGSDSFDEMVSGTREGEDLVVWDSNDTRYEYRSSYDLAPHLWEDRKSDDDGDNELRLTSTQWHIVEQLTTEITPSYSGSNFLILVDAIIDNPSSTDAIMDWRIRYRERDDDDDNWSNWSTIYEGDGEIYSPAGALGTLADSLVWDVPNNKSNAGHQFNFEFGMRRSGGDSSVEIDRRSIIVMEVHH